MLAAVGVLALSDAGLAQSPAPSLLPLLASGWPAGSFAAQAPKLGPTTARVISDSKVDPAFQSTKIARIALLPFANAIQFNDCSRTLAKHLVVELGQKHPEYKVVAPDELMNFITSSKLDDEFNVFLGDYLNTGTSRQDFLTLIGAKQQIDAVLLGKINTCGNLRGRLVLDVEMSLHRVKDARRVWWGRDSTANLRSTDLQEASQDVADVLARYVGRPAF
ncbi:MAG: hypothetical protein IT184_00530 [Acidobacteria bacterium]|nr:hypothetical protein [Acidobacteriota bacterium]